MESLSKPYALYPTFGSDSNSSRRDLPRLPSGNVRVTKRDRENFESRLLVGETYWSLDVVKDYHLTPAMYFDDFYSNLFKRYTKNLAIDGPSCCGKSTLIGKLKPLKMNEYYNVQTANAYNIFPTSAIAYLHVNDVFASHPNMVSDRSAISNITYLLAYYVMNCLTNNLKPDKSAHGLCEEAMDLFNLKSMFSHLRSLDYNILIIMDSSYRHSKKRMLARGTATGSASDLAKAHVQEYHTAQIVAFSFVANILNYPCLDLHYVRKSFGIKSDTTLFKLNADAFTKYNPFTNLVGCSIDMPREATTAGSNFFKTLQGLAIDMSCR